jgi:hypothetical protein
MATPTRSQEVALRKMRGYRVFLQFTTGEVAVAPGREYKFARVIDVNGHVYSYRRYMASRRQNAARRS